MHRRVRRITRSGKVSRLSRAPGLTITRSESREHFEPGVATRNAAAGIAYDNGKERAVILGCDRWRLIAGVGCAGNFDSVLPPLVGKGRVAAGTDNKFRSGADRDALIARLSEAVDVLNHERASADVRSPRETAETKALFGELARVAAGVLASHERLVSSTTIERDRLEAAVRRADKPDAVANQYAAVSQAKQPGTLSVTG